jgi:hypothetical protein
MDKEKINYFEPVTCLSQPKNQSKDTGVREVAADMHQTMILVKIISFRWKN